MGPTLVGMQPGKVLADRYELVAHIGRGGMADVYEAQDRLLGRRVAVKVLHRQFSADEAFVKRFRREAQAAANLSHPNIVSIFDWGEEGATYFIVMELIEGPTLREILKREGRLHPRRATEITAEVAAALAVAHDAGIIWRDGKPGNIMIAADGTVKVTDFGIARALDDSEELTRTGSVIGTATYFSPEQAQGLPADERSDIYSTGVVLYEMLVGKPPFQGESPVAVAYQHVSEPAERPTSENPDVDQDLESLVMRSMEKDPELRYQTALGFRADLLAILQGEKPAAIVPQGEAPTQVIGQDLLPPTVPPDETYREIAASRNPNQIPFILTAFALLIVLAAGLFFLLRELGGTTVTATAVSVPNVVGQAERDALVELQSAGLDVLIDTRADPRVPQGQVIATSPTAGEVIDAGSFVTIIVSTGEEAANVPSVVGLVQSEAEELIVSNGLVVGSVRSETSEEFEAGVVISQFPSGSQKAAPSSSVDLIISTGPSSVLLEDLRGRSQRDAEFVLRDKGLVVVIQEEFDDEIIEGFVIGTEPEPGQVGAGTEVILLVSQGPEPVEVPSLIGLTADEARARVEALGLSLFVSAGTIPGPEDLVGRVAEQFPDAGIEARRGDAVTVTLGSLMPTTTTTTTVPPGDTGGEDG